MSEFSWFREVSPEQPEAPKESVEARINREHREAAEAAAAARSRKTSLEAVEMWGYGETSLKPYGELSQPAVDLSGLNSAAPAPVAPLATTPSPGSDENYTQKRLGYANCRYTFGGEGAWDFQPRWDLPSRENGVLPEPSPTLAAAKIVAEFEINGGDFGKDDPALREDVVNAFNAGMRAIGRVTTDEYGEIFADEFYDTPSRDLNGQSVRDHFVNAVRFENMLLVAYEVATIAEEARQTKLHLQSGRGMVVLGHPDLAASYDAKLDSLSWVPGKGVTDYSLLSKMQMAVERSLTREGVEAAFASGGPFANANHAVTQLFDIRGRDKPIAYDIPIWQTRLEAREAIEAALWPRMTLRQSPTLDRLAKATGANLDPYELDPEDDEPPVQLAGVPLLDPYELEPENDTPPAAGPVPALRKSVIPGP